MSREIDKYDSMAKTYEDQSLTKNEKLIYVYLILLYNNTKQYAYPSYVSLKKALSTTRDDTVSKVIKSLEEKGYIKSEQAIVSVLIPREKVQAQESDYFIERTFSGSLPGFFAAFLGGKKLSKEEADELRKMIAEHEE